MLIHFSAEHENGTLWLHGCMEQEVFDLKAMYKLYEEKCKVWNLDPKLGKCIEIYNDNREILHRYVKSVKST